MLKFLQNKKIILLKYTDFKRKNILFIESINEY